jgi:hypothetical protein
VAPLRFRLVPDRDLHEMLGAGRVSIVRTGTAAQATNLPFILHPASPPLPPGHVTFIELTTGEFWVLAGGAAGAPLRQFAAIPVSTGYAGQSTSR